MRTGIAMKKVVGTGSALQLLPCRWCSLYWCLRPLLSPFYTIFLSPSPLKFCGYCTCLIMMKHVPFSPNLYTTPWHVLRNDLRDLRKCKDMRTAFTSAGWRCWGWVRTNIKMNTKWKCHECINGWALRLLYLLDNDAKRPVLTQPLHYRIVSFTRNVPRDLQAWRTCKLAGRSAGLTLQWKLKNN